MKESEMASFLLRIGTMLEKGYSLYEAIELFGIIEDGRVKESTEKILILLKQGEPLYVALEKLNFPSIILALLYFSEKHGKLAFSLIEGGNILLQKKKNASLIKQQLKYPFFLLFFLTIVLVIVSKQLIPNFLEVFQSMDYNLSSNLEALLKAISIFPYVLMGSIFIACMFLLLLIWQKNKIKIEHISKVPIIQTYVRRFVTQFFCLHLSCLLSSGLSLKESLAIFSKQQYIPFLENETIAISIKLKEGEKIHEILNNSPLFEKELSKVFIHGQANGKLSEDLLHYSNLLYDDLKNSLTKGIEFLQPISFLTIGIIVLVLFIALLVPVFQMIQAI